ncbi:hypothetical protein FJ987_19350 [Mesorhizobium sp. CU2]|uniref:hypothetical protein n=1 Tax=unclassified Mesorhizobium TaxID=325217 RepID=UPI0011265178|nr:MULTISPECIES: hypothetical protein [unclassified Mesorhizobium]TPN80776.1 hypothetical protein FJ988_20015 [Mesorhizobium sp. CU3]TPO11173.1 hypothetical protein FJ987_19350 [Mesorhizobium sp. CU2]
MVSVASDRFERFSIGRAFSNTFSVIGRSFGPLVVIVGLFSTLPALLYNIWSLTQVARMSGGGGATGLDQSAMAGFGAISLIAGLVLMMLAFLAQAALVRATIEDLNGKRPSVGDCIQIALSSFFPTLGIGLVIILALVLAAMVLGVMAMVIPVIGGLIAILALIPMAMWLISISVAVPVLVQERPGVFASISRSRALTKGSRWRVFGLFLIIGIAAMVLQMGFTLLFQLAVVSSGGLTATGIIAGAVGSSLLSTIFSAVISVAIAVTYVELRQVKEGTGVEELAEIFS